MTAKNLILDRLRENSWLAVHEFQIIGVSENAAETRLSELAREGKVIGRVRPGCAYKEWSIRTPEPTFYQPALFAQHGQGAVA